MNKMLKILMVEDTASDADIELTLLKRSGLKFESVVAMTKEDFLLHLDQFEPDLILADNTLPQFSATEALEIIRERSLHIPLILVTGTVSEEFAAGIIKLGAEDYILKDRLVRLPAAIEAALKKKKAEEQLRQQQEQNRFKASLLATVGQAVVATDLNGSVTYWNNAAEKIYGWTEEEAIGNNIIELTPVSFPKKKGNEIMEYLKRGDSWSGEILAKKKDGSIFPAFLTDSPIRNQQGEMTGIIGVSTDISERKKTEQELIEMEQRILNQKIQEQKKITRAVIIAQEQERNYIGRELHDNINQLLAGTKLYLGMAAKNTQNIKETIMYCIELIDNSIEEIRLLSSRHVTPLKNVDLEKLIENLIDNLNKATSIKTVLMYKITNPLNDDLKLNIYRIIQEQTNNIIKHSSAQNVTITIEELNNMINMKVTDDGKGFDITKERSGIGISNIINRVETFNGKFKIESSVGNGCKIWVSLPC
jgi:two-component system sensor histidine kinase UhpB